MVCQELIQSPNSSPYLLKEDKRVSFKDPCRVSPRKAEFLTCIVLVISGSSEKTIIFETSETYGMSSANFVDRKSASQDACVDHASTGPMETVPLDRI